MLIRFEIDTRGYGIPDSDRRILRAIADAGNAKPLEQADTKLAVSPEEIAKEIKWGDPTPVTAKSRQEALDQLVDAVTEHAEEPQEAQGDAQQAHPELHQAFAEENAAAEQEGDEQEGDEDESSLPRHPDGRIVGRAPEGKKRRTKAQIAEDEAWEAAQGANEASDRAPVPDEEPEPPSAGGLIPQQAPQVAQGATEEPEQAAQTPPQDQEAPSPWSW